MNEMEKASLVDHQHNKDESTSFEATDTDLQQKSIKEEDEAPKIKSERLRYENADRIYD